MSVCIARNTISGYPPKRAMIVQRDPDAPPHRDGDQFITPWNYDCFRIAGPRHWRSQRRFMDQAQDPKSNLSKCPCAPRSDIY